MTKIMLHDDAARQALGRGVAKLAKAVRGTLGPNGLNAIIDRPLGTPLVSRDGVSIAAEVELEDPFENMGAQVVREVSMQTNQIAGDGTTTATVLADVLVQQGLGYLAAGANPVELVRGLDLAAQHTVAALRRLARPVRSPDEVRAVAVIAANDAVTGGLVAEALERAGPDGIVTVEYSSTVETLLEVVDGMAFDRGYLSHHMVTDVERMRVVLENPYILMTDLKLQTQDDLNAINRLMDEVDRPVLIIAEEVAPSCVTSLLAGRERRGRPVAAIHPPEYGHWRKAMLEDLAILTGGKVIARDLGGRLEDVRIADLGMAREVRISFNQTVITAGAGDPAAIAARRRQVARQVELAPPNIERDKLEERLAKLSGGTATILAGGMTPVEQKRTAQLIEDAINAARAAVAEGIVPGGGTALLHISPLLGEFIGGLSGSVKLGAALLQTALAYPMTCIVANCGIEPEAILDSVAAAEEGVGFDVRAGKLANMIAEGIIDPVKVTIAAVQNAVSVAVLILTTHTLIAKKPDVYDPTAGVALGGGAELLGRA